MDIRWLLKSDGTRVLQIRTGPKRLGAVWTWVDVREEEEQDSVTRKDFKDASAGQEDRAEG